MPKRILIVEDELEIKELLTLIATRYGYDVVSATDGAELTTIAAVEKFDVVKTDLRFRIEA
jgi:DNA-binding response OmpR family regulator